jgi:hypothetical protein
MDIKSSLVIHNNMEPKCYVILRFCRNLGPMYHGNLFGRILTYKNKWECYF